MERDATGDEPQAVPDFDRLRNDFTRFMMGYKFGLYANRR